MAINFPQTIQPDILALTKARSVQSPETLVLGSGLLSPLKEYYLVLITGGASGGAAQSFYTDSTTYQNLNPSEFVIDPANYPGASFFLEAVCRAGASGDPARTFFMDLYNVTDGVAVTNSEISTTSTEGAAGPGSLVRLRGGTSFKGNMGSGSKTYVLRYRSDTSARFVDLYYARLVISYGGEATFGKLVGGDSENQDGGTTIRGSKFTLSESGNITSMLLYCRVNATGTVKIKMAIYADNGSNAPSTRKLVSAETSITNTGFGWATCAVSPAVNLASGSYWLVWQNDGGTGGGGLWFSKNTLANGVAYVGATYSTFPDPFGTASYHNFEVTIYATYVRTDV